jgi:hypothetical protein
MDTLTHKIRCHGCNKTIKVSFVKITEFIDKMEKAGWYDKPAPDPRDGVWYFCPDCKVKEFQEEEEVYQNDSQKR